MSSNDFWAIWLVLLAIYIGVVAIGRELEKIRKILETRR